MPAPTINQHYTEDHEQLRAFFHRFQSLKAGDHGKAMKAFHEFKTGLEQHILWEERILLPWYDKQLGHLRNCLIPSLRREHAQILVCLKEIAEKLARETLRPKMKRQAWKWCSACTIKRKKKPSTPHWTKS